MKALTTKSAKRERRQAKIRATISGTTERPRLSVFKSNTQIYAQLIDDTKGETLASAKGTDPKKVGMDIAKSALEKKVETVVFDRGGYVYTGKVKAVAEGAREGGLKF
jgi:large subunit ribosomal protein L18